MTGAGPVRSELSLRWSAASGQVAEGGSAAAWQDLAAQASRLAEPVGVQIPADHTPSYREWSETVPSSFGHATATEGNGVASSPTARAIVACPARRPCGSPLGPYERTRRARCRRRVR